MECLKTAFRFGADAVYLGGRMLQLRAEKAAFSDAMLEEAVNYTHGIGKRLYVTLNSFVKNSEIGPLGEYARWLRDTGTDAVIVSDLGALAAVKAAAPGFAVHISTQANCCNYMAARTYYDMGAERVVLARELSIDEIAELRVLTPPDLELEAFVHGAMCMAYSGRCLISSYLNNRSGNRGECTQPCRWNYHLVEQKRPGEFFEVEEGGGYSAVLSSHDLNCISFLDKLCEAGITSFKIEGRMKTLYYVATVTNAYRRRMDNTQTLAELEAELNSVSHRPYSSGFYFGEMKTNHNNDGGYRWDRVFIGVVKGCGRGRVSIEQRNSFAEGDGLEILSPDYFGAGFTARNITDSAGQNVRQASLVQGLYTMDCPYELHEGDILRKRLTERG